MDLIRAPGILNTIHLVLYVGVQTGDATAPVEAELKLVQEEDQYHHEQIE